MYIYIVQMKKNRDSHLAGKTWDGGPILTHARNSSGRLETCVLFYVSHSQELIQHFQMLPTNVLTALLRATTTILL